jgi:hypothetical protein
VILFRCFPWDRAVDPGARGGALWFPRLVQGAGRHDNPLLYGCLYATARAVSAIVEQLARFAGTALTQAELSFAGLPLALGTIELADEAALVDLDEPRVLAGEGLRPSLVATRERARTQADAAGLFERHQEAAGLRWWSTFESQWPNVTLFDRAERHLAVREIRPLALTDDDVAEAAEFLALGVSR